MNSGYLDLILGPMFSGKTSRLIELYYIHYLSSRLLVVNHASDTRYTNDSKMVAHNNVSIPCKLVRSLSELEVDMNNYDRILINEGQLFPDLYEFVMEQVYKNKKYVWVAGLDGDYKCNPIGQMIQLIPHADSIVKLHGKCSICVYRPSIFTLRTTDDKEQVLIGTDQYKPVCRMCYEIHNKHL
jgi:thymidine kinase